MRKSETPRVTLCAAIDNRAKPFSASAGFGQVPTPGHLPARPLLKPGMKQAIATGSGRANPFVRMAGAFAQEALGLPGEQPR